MSDGRVIQFKKSGVRSNGSYIISMHPKILELKGWSKGTRLWWYYDKYLGEVSLRTEEQYREAKHLYLIKKGGKEE